MAYISNDSLKQGIYLKDIDYKSLNLLYQKYGYTEYASFETLEIPAIFLQKFPDDFSSIQDQNLRNELFIKIITPLVLKVNDDILNERNQILSLQKQFHKTKNLSEAQNQFLENTSQKYDIFTRFRKQDRQIYLLQELEKRINIVPPSILITLSAIQTGWGSSRVVKEGNSLYKEFIWDSDQGLIPENREEGSNYRIKTFSSLYDSIYSIALKINSHINFTSFRNYRNTTLKNGYELYSKNCIPDFFLFSQEENFLGLLKYTMMFYNLDIIDIKKLDYNLHPSPPKT